MTASAARTPTDIRRLGKTGIEIRWSDGHHSQYDNHDLRQHCPCAGCREHPRRSLPVVGTGGTPLFPTRIGVVGRYAISIQWSDGHDTGIYSYRTLRDVCPCAACRPQPRVPEEPATAARPKANV